MKDYKMKMSVLWPTTVAFIMMVTLAVSCDMDSTSDNQSPITVVSPDRTDVPPPESGTPTDSDTPGATSPESGTPVDGTPPESGTPTDSGTDDTDSIPPLSEGETPDASGETPSEPTLEDTPQSGTLETLTLHWGDANFEGIPDILYLSRSQKNKMPSSIRITVSNDFDTVIWRMDEKEQELSGNKSFTLAAKDVLIGTHRLSLKVIKDSVPYSKTITIVVTI
jgi:hypothetical protein